MEAFQNVNRLREISDLIESLPLCGGFRKQNENAEDGKRNHFNDPASVQLSESI